MKKIMFMILACAAGAHAETKTWLGNDGDFSTPAQWSGSSVPVAGDDVVISNGVVTVLETDSAFFELNSIDLDDPALLSISNNADRVYFGTTSGSGTLVKEGSGRLQWEALSGNHYGHAATIVNNGTITLGTNTSSYVDGNFGTFTVNAPGTVETLKYGNTNFRFLWGDGTLTNTLSAGSEQQLRIIDGPSEFAGEIHGKIRYYSRGEFALTGTNSTFIGNFAIHSQSGPGITGAKKIGMIGLPSSIGTSDSVDIRESGGTFRYLGTGETTDKGFVLYPSANRAVIDGGLYGGVIFNGKWGTSGGHLNRLAITGKNATPCVFNGDYAEHSQYGTNYSTYIAKEGTGTWIFNDNTSRSNRGVVDVREGTLQFESIAESGQICSLGRSDQLFEDVINRNTNGLGVAYAFSLGTASTVGTLEYIGTTPGSCSTRKLVLQGDGRLKSDGVSLAFSGGVESLTSGAKTLYLDGSATNAIGSVSDGAGTVGITKEGAGFWSLSSTNTFSGPLEVKAGQLQLDKSGYTYYRFNLEQRNYGVVGGDSNIELTEFALYSADGVRRNLNLVKNGTNNVAGLNPGEFCPMAPYSTYATRTDINLFDATSSQWTTYSSPPLTLVMRLADDTPPITGYDLQYFPAHTVERYLSGWSVEGSRDGATWDMLDTVTDYDPIPPAVFSGGVHWWYSTGTSSPTNDFPIADGSMTNAQLTAGVQVSVAAGAELAFVGGNEPLSALSVDCDAGGGTINGLFLESNGRMDLTGSSIEGGNFTVPLAIENFSNPELLENWSVYINDELINGVVLIWDETSGTLRVATLGTIIIIH
ncbi:MAG: autotransporter-associated beta strand repeat-containing protein [Kiritimatiellae bacterium]|jgi:autotransporter-associated beta strand protein|nr:autotransporter-associated beta strand repeat-containing protein [Kiritimatiellia bacterium]